MNDPKESPPATADFVENPSHSPETRNPFVDAASVTFDVPETVSIKLVEASALADYETFGAITSILIAVASGFFVATVEGAPEQLTRNIVNTAVFSLLALICFFAAASKRKKMAAKVRRVKYRLGAVIPDDKSEKR